MNPFDKKELVGEILANLNILIYSMDHRNSYLFIGQQCEDFTGYSADSFMGNDRRWLSYIHASDRDLYREKIAGLSTNDKVNVEYRFVCKDGTVKWFKDSATAVRDADDNLIRIDGTIQDISAQRTVEKELKLIRSAINSANNGIIIVDAQQPAMPIIFANHAFEELTGYTFAEVLGKNCRILQSRDRFQEGLNILREAIQQSKKANVILRNYKKNGELFYNHIYISPIRDESGVVTHFIGVQYDVTEKVELQQKLKAYYEKEKYLRYIMASIADLNKMIGTAKNPAYIFRNMCLKLIENPPYQYVWIGLLDQEQVFKEYAMGKETIEPTKKHKYMKDIRKRLDKKAKAKGIMRGKNRLLGHWVMIPLLYHMQPHSAFGYLSIYTHHEEGFIDEEITMLRDLTSTVSSAIEYQKVDQLMFYQARQAAMGELIGHMAHQWRQPINELGLILQDLRDAFLCKELDETYIVTSTKDGMELLQQMSGTIDDFRRFFVGGHQKGSFQIAEVVQQSVDLVESHFNKLGIYINIVEEDPVSIDGYAREFAQVVLNLLNNARDAFVRRKIAKPYITIRITAKEETAVIMVEDNAGGIADQSMEHIFDQYYSTKDNHQGAGLGLYISKMIIENAMQGKLSAINTMEGVNFILEVPMNE